MRDNLQKMMDDSEKLDREDWLQIMQDLLEVGPILKESVKRVCDNIPEAARLYAAMDPETFELDMRAACAAIAYVAEFAADKCRFIMVKEE